MVGNPCEPISSRSTERGVSPVIGVVLLVSIVVLLAAVVGATTLGFSDELDGPSPTDAQISLESDGSGTNAVVQSVQSPVEIRVNGQPFTTVRPSDTGEELFLPTAPGDQVTVVSSGDTEEILLRETIDPASGNFVGYYTYDGSGNTIEDQSSNDNDATISGDPVRGSDANGTYLEFDGQDDFATADSLTVSQTDEVSELSIAVKFRINGETGSIQQLVEHTTPTGEEVFLETNNNGPFNLDYAVKFPEETVTTSGRPLETGEVYTAVGTFDESTGEYKLYIDGTQVASGTHSRAIELGQFRMARDDEANIQHLDGRLYETRFYFTELSDDEVEQVTSAMERSN